VEFAEASGAPGEEGRPTPSLRRRVRQRLLAWFETNRRDLPWRRSRDPYPIWVSEVMLQQTTVAAVVPYFERFLHAFPTLRDLSAAPEQEVLRLWEGLGYYRRARDLHRAARQLADAGTETIPDDPDTVSQLPGMGRYTLGAVLSQAFDRRLPILEANSLRVLCRLFGRTDDPRRGPAQRWLWKVAEDLLPVKRVGDFNQALMELGALVCTPTAPRCEDCPLAADCVTRRLGLQADIPAKAPPAAITEVREAAVVIRRGGAVLLVQRPESASRWANLWEFPHGPLDEGESHEAAALRLARALTGLDVTLGPALLTLRHGITRYRITMACFEAESAAGEFRSDFYRQGQWVTPERLADYPVSAPQRRLAKAVVAPQRQRTLF
jgi:A/G-specific adenine glycosylase